MVSFGNDQLALIQKIGQNLQAAGVVDSHARAGSETSVYVQNYLTHGIESIKIRTNPDGKQDTSELYTYDFMQRIIPQILEKGVDDLAHEECNQFREILGRTPFGSGRNPQLYKVNIDNKPYSILFYTGPEDNLHIAALNGDTPLPFSQLKELTHIPKNDLSANREAMYDQNCIALADAIAARGTSKQASPHDLEMIARLVPKPGKDQEWVQWYYYNKETDSAKAVVNPYRMVGRGVSSLEHLEDKTHDRFMPGKPYDLVVAIGRTRDDEGYVSVLSGVDIEEKIQNIKIKREQGLKRDETDLFHFKDPAYTTFYRIPALEPDFGLPPIVERDRKFAPQKPNKGIPLG
jgi:hypothetical protein